MFLYSIHKTNKSPPTSRMFFFDLIFLNAFYPHIIFSMNYRYARFLYIFAVYILMSNTYSK